jgi:hypothetical protein
MGRQPTKPELAEALWPTLRDKIDNARWDDSLVMPHVADVVYEAHCLAGESKLGSVRGACRWRCLSSLGDRCGRVLAKAHDLRRAAIIRPGRTTTRDCSAAWQRCPVAVAAAAWSLCRSCSSPTPRGVLFASVTQAAAQLYGCVARLLGCDGRHRSNGLPARRCSCMRVRGD